MNSGEYVDLNRYEVKGADVVWVATLNEDYQPTPAVSYFGIGPKGVPRILDQFRELVSDRDRTGTSNPGVLLIVDPDLDTGDLSRIVSDRGERLGVKIARAVFLPEPTVRTSGYGP